MKAYQWTQAVIITEETEPYLTVCISTACITVSKFIIMYACMYVCVCVCVRVCVCVCVCVCTQYNDCT